MQNKKYIILNFLHGNGPYLRTMELALAVNDFLEKNGKERFGIIVPWVYKLRQKEIIEKNFKKIIKKYPDEILLDEKLGGYLWSIFYNGFGFGEWLGTFLKKYKKIEKEIQDYIAGGLTAKSLGGKEFLIKREDIAMEINRSPLVSFGITPSYYASFGHMSEILEKSINEKDISIDENIIKEALPVYEEIEKKQTLHFIAEPATFSYLENRPLKYGTETYTPPNINQLFSINKIESFFVRKGIYVSVTGIYGVNHLFDEIKNIGLKVYTHKKGLMPFGVKSSPAIMSHKNIFLHFARVGWGSCWASFLTETPLIVPQYDSKDDPEVYFNNVCLEKIGLAKVYAGQPLDELLEWGKEYKKNAQLIKKNLMDKYGTLNGVEYTAEKIVNHYLNVWQK